MSGLSDQSFSILASFLDKKKPHREMRLFSSLLRRNYFFAGAAGAAGAAAGAASFFSAFFAFFAFFFLAAFFTSFFSAAGAATSAFAGAAGAFAGSAANATAEKETATRAATSVDRTFFICTTSKGMCLTVYIADCVPLFKNMITHCFNWTTNLTWILNSK
jgi:hypothetical protein